MTAAEPLVSIALCTYNGERHLREQMDSILAQEGVRIEVVALDDGSTDGTVALLRDYAARDPRIAVHVNEKNLGHLRSFEKAMGLCTGAFIAPSDQDDVWEPRKLRVLLDAIGDADLAYCDSAYIDDAGRPMGYGISDELKMIAGKEPLRFVFGNSVSGHASLVRRTLYDIAVPFPEGLFHDWWLAMCAAGHAGLVYVDRPLVCFRRHATAFSPIGKKKADRKARELHFSHASREAARKVRRARYAPWVNRKWVEERRRMAQLYGARDLRGADAARALDAALSIAIDARRYVPLWRWLWRHRSVAPPSPWRWATAWNALKFHQRTVRKIERARQEPPVGSPLFHA